MTGAPFFRLARAIARAVQEHGAPNRFALVELRDDYFGPPPSAAGEIMADTQSVVLLEAALSDRFRLTYGRDPISRRMWIAVELRETGSFA